MKRFLMACIFTSSVLGCGTPTKNFQEKLAAKQCEAALIETPEKQPFFSVMNKVEQGLGTTGSYLLTGSTLTAEVLVATTGIMGLAIVCSKGACPSNFPDIPWSAGSWTSKVWEKTAPMRCAAVDGLSQSVRQVAKCYEKEGPEGPKKAHQTLLTVRETPEIYDCLSDREKQSLHQDLSTYQNWALK